MDRGDLHDIQVELAAEAADQDTPENRTRRDLLDALSQVNRPLEELDDVEHAACELVNGAARRIDGLMKAAVAFDRARGATWEEIGARLRISKQAAWERFGP